MLNWRARQGGWVQWWYATVEAAFDRAWDLEVEIALEDALEGIGVLAPWPLAVRGKEGPTLEISVRVEAVDRELAAAAALRMVRDALLDAGVPPSAFRLGEPELITVDEHEAERRRLAEQAGELLGDEGDGRGWADWRPLTRDVRPGGLRPPGD